MSPPAGLAGNGYSLIEASGLVVRYATTDRPVGNTARKFPALDGCSVRMEKGLVHGIIGPGGCGKTTLLKVIATLVVPEAGSLSIFGKKVDQLDKEGLRDLRSRIGMQFQNLALFDFLDVFGNVAFAVLQSRNPPPEHEVRREVERLLEAMGLGGSSGLRVNELSGGMQRRVAIARVLMEKPEICIHDDPTAGLDPVTSSRIFRLLRNVQREHGLTMIIASHDVDRLLNICDKVHVMRAGRVIFSGTVEEAKSCDDPEIAKFFRGEKSTG